MKFVVVIIAMSFASVAFAAGAPKSTPALLEKGKAAFLVNCMPCHGEKGDGEGPAGLALKTAGTPPRNFGVDPFKQGEKPADVFKTITAGVAGTPMVGFPQLSEEDRWGMSYHVLALRKAGKKK